MPTFTDLEVSPGGKYLVARMFREDRYNVILFKLVDGRIQPVYRFSEDEKFSISWFEWVSPTKLVLSTGYSATRGSWRVQTEERRLLAFDAETKEIWPLYRSSRKEVPIQIQDRIVSFLPKDPDHILVQYSTLDPSAPNVYRVNVNKTSRHKVVQKVRSSVRRWTADVDGDVRLGEGLENGNTPYLTARLKDDRGWTDLSHRVRALDKTFKVIEFSDKPNEIYVTSNHEGDPSGLYTFDIATDTFGPLIFKHETVDVSSVNIDEQTGVLLSVNFVDDEIETHRISERPIREAIRKLHDQMPGHDLRTRSISSDGNFAVLRLSENAKAGQYLILDSTKNTAFTLPLQYPGLVDVPLRKTISTEYVARDGLTIPAFLTLPAGFESLNDAERLPFVIHPHGGPAARDFMRFNFDVQYFVSRGYGVLQMNFRGSTGYGQEFKDAGKREWGQAMQDDITDGVAWLVDNNYADADRIAIVGESYGGYAALMGVVKTPDLYQCAVSFAGVSDLPELLADAAKYVDGRYAARFVGDRWQDRKMLAEYSPARRADEINVPVLLIHGEEDTAVEFDQSEKMAKQLKKHGKEYKFVQLKTGDHFHSLYENRLLYLQEMDAFLDECLN